MGEFSDEPMVDAIRNGHRYADAVDTVKLLKREGYIISIFHGNVANFIIAINNEWKARRMCQHTWCTTCTDKAKTEVGCRPKYEIPPSLINVPELVPPFLTVHLFPPARR
jgi:hypothetical protein